MLKKWEIEKIEQKKNAFGTKFRLSLKTNIFGTKKKWCLKSNSNISKSEFCFILSLPTTRPYRYQSREQRIHTDQPS